VEISFAANRKNIPKHLISHGRWHHIELASDSAATRELHLSIPHGGCSPLLLKPFWHRNTVPYRRCYDFLHVPLVGLWFYMNYW